jgi:hypothetical protein
MSVAIFYHVTSPLIVTACYQRLDTILNSTNISYWHKILRLEIFIQLHTNSTLPKSITINEGKTCSNLNFRERFNTFIKRYT